MSVFIACVFLQKEHYLCPELLLGTVKRILIEVIDVHVYQILQFSRTNTQCSLGNSIY